ncbi:MAG: HAMP domain-containing protein [Desulfuromonadales bacterium]|nr:MAG: HAMP domain-containing protein [Desulfuromonadales bacterium]
MGFSGLFRHVRESFGARLFVAFGVLIVLIILSFGGFYLSDQRTSLRESLMREGAYLARNLAYNARVGVFAENPSMLRGALEGIAQYEGVLAVAVYTRDGRVLVEEPEGGRSSSSVPAPPAERFRSLASAPTQVRFEHPGSVEFWAPIALEAGRFSEDDLYFGKTRQDQGTRTIGFARVVIDKEVSGRKFKSLIVRSVGLLALCLLASGFVSYLIVRQIIRPLDRLTEGVHDVEEGGFTRVPVETNDEVGRVAVAFNHMVDALERRETERNRAEEEIRALNTELENRVLERTAALEEANRELKSFNYSVSHDLRSPLARIEGLSQALKEDYDDKLDDTGRFYLERMSATCVQMDQIIKAMMSLSQASRSEIRRERFDLSGLVARVVDTLHLAEPERQVRVVVEPGVHAYGDPRLVSIAIENLIGNAWKFTGGRTDARIEFGSGPVAARQMYFIRDNGSGFDMKYAAKLFQPFERLHGPEKFPGTGIGLAIVKKIIDRHAGDISLESEEGRGATVTFSLTPDPLRIM